MNSHFCRGFEKTAIALPMLGRAGKVLTTAFMGLEAMNAAQRAASRTNAMRGVKSKMTGTAQAMNNVPRNYDVHRGIRQTYAR